MQTGTVWKFATKNFRVELSLERLRRYRYDGDDENGETQAALDSGELVAFAADVTVYYRGEQIGFDCLCGSVYKDGDEQEFWTAHRSADPMNRNCTIMRRAWRGENNPDAKVSICHYFPGMVSEAIAEARAWIRDERSEAQAKVDNLPFIRESA